MSSRGTGAAITRGLVLVKKSLQSERWALLHARVSVSAAAVSPSSPHCMYYFGQKATLFRLEHAPLPGAWSSWVGTKAVKQQDRRHADMSHSPPQPADVAKDVVKSVE